MKKRIDIKQTDPEAYKAMYELEKYMANTQLTAQHKDLIKIRASQINRCAYCIDLHTKEARKGGETEQRIYALNVWRETPFFTGEERAILALTEEVTLISAHVSESTYHEAVEVLGEIYLAQVIMAIVVINGWNRIGIATGMSPTLN